MGPALPHYLPSCSEQQVSQGRLFPRGRQRLKTANPTAQEHSSLAASWLLTSYWPNLKSGQEAPSARGEAMASHSAKPDINGAGGCIPLVGGRGGSAQPPIMSNLTSLLQIAFSLVFTYFFFKCIPSCFKHARYSIKAQGIELFTFLLLLYCSIAF